MIKFMQKLMGKCKIRNEFAFKNIHTNKLKQCLFVCDFGFNLLEQLTEHRLCDPNLAAKKKHQNKIRTQ